MAVIKKCKCGLAAVVAFLAGLLVAYINGYTLGNWASSTWIAVFLIALAAAICLRCRQKEDESGGAHSAE